MRTAVRVSRRQNGGVRVAQGRNFLMLTSQEAAQLAADIQQLTDSAASGAETATANGVQ